MTNETSLILWSCNGHVDQSWTEASVGDPYVELQNNTNLGKCAGVAASAITDGSKMVIWNCTDNDDQSWEPIFAWQDANRHDCFYFQNLNAEILSEHKSVITPAHLGSGQPIVLQRLLRSYTEITQLDQYWCAY